LEKRSPAGAPAATVDAQARRQALLDEYREAGAHCRNYELLMRTK